MPISDQALERKIISVLLEPTTTVEELLLLFNEQQPQQLEYYAIIAIGTDRYDVLQVNDLREPLEKYGRSLATMALGAVPGLLWPTAPLSKDQTDAAAAEQAKNASPRCRLVVLNANGAVVGVLIGDGAAIPKGLGDPLTLLNPPGPLVLGAEESAPAPLPAPPSLNAGFDGLAPNQPLTVGSATVLRVAVGVPTATTRKSGVFKFDFAGSSDPVSFNVLVDGDPDTWEIMPVKPVMIVAPPGTTTQDAMFMVTANQAGQDTLTITVERADTGAMVQKLWLKVVAGATASAQSLVAAVPADAPIAAPRLEVSLPISSTDITRRQIEITIQSSAQSFQAVVRADFPDEAMRATYTVPVSGEEIQRAALRLRAELQKIVYYPGKDSGGPFPFANNSTLMIDEAVARTVTAPLADAAQQVWQMLFTRPDAPDGLKQFANKLRSMPEQTSIQIILDNANFIIPWTLLYDKPGKVTPENLDWSGFWGHRYIIDVLPPGRYPAPTIESTPLSMQLLFNDDANLSQFTTAQEQFVRTKLGGVQVNVVRGSAAVQQALAAPIDAGLLYFYCHGDHVGDEAASTLLASESALLFGGPDHLRIVDLRNLPAAPLARRPLVFLNACEGGTQDAFFYDGFMPFFIREQLARGFIGTEVKAPQLLAHEFAMLFLTQFAQGRPVGQILWDLRRKYLDENHNILAFNYTLYSLSEVRLTQALIANAG